jgi:hypothetical protein
MLGGDGGWWIAGIAAFVGIVAIVRRAAGVISHERAGYLVRWLNGVLDRLPAASPAPPPPVGEPARSAPEG